MLIYTYTFLELQGAFILLIKIHTCPVEYCQFCDTPWPVVDALLRNKPVIKFVASDELKTCKIPVDTLTPIQHRCDQIMSSGNFTRVVFGKDPNTCKNHALGDFCPFNFCPSYCLTMYFYW
jgi:hypothetical protein